MVGTSAIAVALLVGVDSAVVACDRLFDVANHSYIDAVIVPVKCSAIISQTLIRPVLYHKHKMEECV
ncbi:MAG: hypothetical protein C7B45_01480 [Sulfobacillus acidophilus]|uniref:Uncharacterized protein n=1 Tax=Sulfobacillus acidophilus TaxID=53633 RepID=A0A2T2WP07_9FIRM|nr:MAG: hypothetical protein C7B45_01480 [Sulfobacillus acidophilus]